MNINEAIEEFEFFHEGDYITSNMKEAKDIVLKELKKKDKYKFYYEATEQQRRADIEVIDKLKGSCLRKNKIINLMEDYIEKAGTTDDFCISRYENVTTDCDKNCKLCIRKYFYERCK